MSEEMKEAFAQSIADYMRIYGKGFDWMTPEEAAMGAIRVLTDDIGAAQNFLNVIGVKVDLYSYEEPDVNHVTKTVGRVGGATTAICSCGWSQTYAKVRLAREAANRHKEEIKEN